MIVNAYSRNGNKVGEAKVVTVKGEGWGNGYTKYEYTPGVFK